MTCKLKGLSPEPKSSSDDSDGGGLGGIWQKIKNFGGKNVGEAG